MHQIIRERNEMSLKMAATPGFRLTAWLVFEQLTRWENSRTGYTQPGQATIARAIGRSRKAVNEAVAWLREHAFIKTQQRYVLHRDRTLFGTLRYWMAKEWGQVEWLLAQAQRTHVAKWIQGARKKPPAPQPKHSKEAVEAYWLQQLGCNPGVTSPSNQESNTESLMSPALKRWLENDKLRR